MDTYNQMFSNEMMMVPEMLNDCNTELVMQLYGRGIMGAPGTAVYARVLQQAISKKEVKDVHELMALMRVTEQNELWIQQNQRGQNYGSNRGATYASARNYSNGFNKFSKPVAQTPFRGNKGNANSVGANPNWRRDTVSPLRPQALSFQTPRVNHMDAVDRTGTTVGDAAEQYHDGETEHYDADENESGRESGNESKTDRDDEDESFLNAVRIFEQLKKENVGITPDEFDRRRRNGTCFRCNKEGHYANKCPSNSNKFPNKKNF